MKKYKEYMDGVEAPDTLHQRLLGLETPAGRPALWKRYGAVAAALVLVVCLGAFGLGGGWDAIARNFRPAVVMGPENVGVPDIAPEAPGDEMEPGEKTIGGYEVTVGSGSEAMVSYYVLPYIEYGKTGRAASQAALDWDIPQGAVRRDLSQDEIVRLMGGGDAVGAHLDWDGYELTGWGAWNGDGSFWGAYLYGYQGPMDHFEFAVTADQLPPTCIAYAESAVRNIHGVMVTAAGYDGKDGCSRRVSFMKDDYGYLFDLTATDTEQAELLASRLVCHVADRGLDQSFFSGLTVIGNGTYTCPICGENIPATQAEEHQALHSQSLTAPVYACPDCGETFPLDQLRAHIHSFYVCDICGNTFPVGAEHNDPYVFGCPDCGASYVAGTEHHCELCALPVAPSPEPTASSSSHHDESHHESGHH